MAGKHLNVGLLAHVDAGKTTLAEAILHTCGKIRNWEEWIIRIPSLIISPRKESVGSPSFPNRRIWSGRICPLP